MFKKSSKFACLKLQWQIQGRGPGGPAFPPPPLIFRPDWGLKIQKDFFWRLGPPLTKGVDDHPPPPHYSPPSSQGLDPALSCTYILLVVAIVMIIGQLINRFSFNVFSLWHYLTVTVQGKHFILSLKVRGLRNRVKRNSTLSFLKDRNDWKLSKSSILLFCLLNITCTWIS